MMDTETSNDDEVSVTEMLELQLSEIEMLQSMFPDTREFKLDDQAAVINIKGFLSGQIKYDYLYDRIGFTVHLELENSKTSLELVCNLPHEYPSVPPVVFTRSPSMDKNSHRKLNEDLTEFINGIERGEICMYSIIEWIKENLNQYFDIKDDTSDNSKPRQEEDTLFTRLWIYSHHIYSKFKRRDIIDWAEELKLTGFSLPGKPGVVCVEGYSRPVDEYWHRLRRLNWKRLAIREKDDLDIGNDDIAKYRKFSNFEEKVFDVRGGKGREYHMDLGKFYTFLEQHGFSHIFHIYFGVDGKSAPT